MLLWAALALVIGFLSGKATSRIWLGALGGGISVFLGMIFSTALWKINWEATGESTVGVIVIAGIAGGILGALWRRSQGTESLSDDQTQSR